MTPLILAAHTEKSLLSAIFRHPEQFQRIMAENITGESFSVPLHRTVFTAMKALSETGIGIDLVSVAQKIGSGCEVEVAQIFCDDFGFVENIPGWIRQLREYEARRFLYARCCALCEAVQNSETSPEEIIAQAKTDAEKATEIMGGKHYPTLTEIKDEFLQKMIEGPRPTIPMFPPETQGGCCIQLHAGEMFVLGGVTGTGKTALCCSSALTQLEAGLVVAYFCTESSAADIFARLTAAKTGVSHYALGNRNRSYANLKTLAEGGKSLHDSYGNQLFVFGCDSGSITPDVIRSRCQAICNQTGRIDVVYIDFLQNVKPRKHLRNRPALEQINDTVQEIHSILLEYQAAGIIPAQFNRSSQYQKGKPGLTAFRDTSEIEQLAHTVAILWREKEGEETQLYSLKTRNQPPFTAGFPLIWTGTRYESAHTPGLRPVPAEYGPDDI